MTNARPLLFLVLLTPCVEFLTGSTSFGAATTVPSAAFTFFLLTWPSYAFPVLLIREAVRGGGQGRRRSDSTSGRASSPRT